MYYWEMTLKRYIYILIYLCVCVSMDICTYDYINVYDIIHGYYVQSWVTSTHSLVLYAEKMPRFLHLGGAFPQATHENGVLSRRG